MCCGKVVESCQHSPSGTEWTGLSLNLPCYGDIITVTFLALPPDLSVRTPADHGGFQVTIEFKVP